jgi:hypothetical protein
MNPTRPYDEIPLLDPAFDAVTVQESLYFATIRHDAMRPYTAHHA